MPARVVQVVLPVQAVHSPRAHLSSSGRGDPILDLVRLEYLGQELSGRVAQEATG